jgi:hypothetical protein
VIVVKQDNTATQGQVDIYHRYQGESEWSHDQFMEPEFLNLGIGTLGTLHLMYSSHTIFNSFELITGPNDINLSEIMRKPKIEFLFE